MKFKVNYRLADVVDELLKNKTLVLDDGVMSREIARALSPLHRNGSLMVGFDRKLGKSILIVNGVEKIRRKNVPFGKSIFEIA